jgi:hypothetical protein
MYTVPLLRNKTHTRVLQSLLLKHFKLLDTNISHTSGILLQEPPGLKKKKKKNKQKLQERKLLSVELAR